MSLTPDPSLNLAALERIDRNCLAFEQAWQNGQTPQIEAYLGDVREPERSSLLYQLLLLELGYLSHRGDTPSLAQYRRRFSGHSALIDTAFDKQSELSTDREKVPELEEQHVHEKRAVAGSDASAHSGLPIRCPHCHKKTEIVVDTPLADMTCSACGNQFSLVGEGPVDSTIGHFELIERLGIGRFGVVWKARDTKLDRTVAVKIPRSGQTDPVEAEQFMREARAAAQLLHPNIVSVHEVGRDGNRVYIVSDLVDGLSLADWLTGQRVTVREAVELCEKIARALHYAHQMGIVHRDMKPANIMIDVAGEPHVMDFGLAKREVGEVTMTLDGQLLGTPAYMSPEQAKGEAHEADCRSDVYSLGVILFELLTGERPYRGSARMLLHQVIHEEAPSPRKLNSTVPRDLETICLKCLEKDLDRRYETAQEVGDELRRFLAGKPILARPLGMIERYWRWAKRRPASAALIGVSVLAAVTFAGAVVTFERNHRIDQERQRVTAALTETEAAREQQEVYKYFYLTALAHVEWKDGNVARMQTLLGDCPPAQRRWEWHYLNRLCHKDLFTLDHPNRVQYVAFSPDGDLLASACWDACVRIWNARDGKELMTLKGHTKGVRTVVFSPDGTKIASSSEDSSVRLWNISSGQEILRLLGHRGPVPSVAFSGDGSRLASGGADRTIRIWDADDGEELQKLIGHRDVVNRVAFHPNDDNQVASACGDGLLILWDVRSGKPLRSIHAHTPRAVQSLAFSPDGSKLASASWDESIKVWDVQTGGLIGELLGHKNSVLGVAFSPDAKHIASAGQDHTIRVWNIDEMSQQCVIRGHTDWVRCAAFTPDGTRIASAGWDDTVRLWRLRDVQNSECTVLRHGDGRVTAATFNPSGALVASASPDTNPMVRIFDVASKQTKYDLGDDLDRATSVAFSPNGRLIATAGYDGAVRTWLSDTGAVQKVLVGHASIVNCIAFNPSGEQLASASSDHTVKIWELDTGVDILTLDADEDDVLCLAYSPLGDLLASGGRDGKIRLWSTPSGEQQLVIDAHPSQFGVYSLAFSPDGKRLASGSADRLVNVWDATTGVKDLTIRGHNDDILGVAFDASGKRLASASKDRTVRIWDTGTGEEVLSLLHDSDVYSVEFSADSNLLLSADLDGRIYVWDGRPLAPSSRDTK